MAVELDLDRSETTPLVVQRDQPTPTLLGRSWNWLRSSLATTAGKARAIVGTASAVGLATAGYFATKSVSPTSDYTFGTLKLIGIGVGLALPSFLYAVLPQSTRRWLADASSKNSFEIMYLLMQLYKYAGCPVPGAGLWDTSNPPIAIHNGAVITQTAIAATVTLLQLRQFRLLFSAPAIPQLPDRDEPNRLLFEAITAEIKRFMIEQAVKVGLGATCLGLSFIPQLEDTPLAALGYYLFGHTLGAVGTLGYLAVKKRFIAERIQNEKVKFVISKIGDVAKLLFWGAIITWQSDASYLCTGAVVGASKIANLAKFEALSQNDEEVGPLITCRKLPIATAIVYAFGSVWELSKLAHSGGDVSRILKIACRITFAASAYPLTRYLARAFKPEEGRDRRLFNTIRFTFVNHPAVFIVPYMMLDVSEPNESVYFMIKHFLYHASLGMGIGVNRALQDGRIERSPAAVSDPAQLLASYILWNSEITTSV